MNDIESIIGQVKPAETMVPLCLDGPLVAEYERLEVLLRDAGPATSLGDETSAEAIAERMEALREQMIEARAWFTMRALTKGRWRGMQAALPVKAEGQSDEDAAAAYHQWVCKLVSATCAEPAMSQEQADRLHDALSDGQWQALSNAAWAVNTQNQAIPFSVAASALTRRSAAKSRRPEPSVNHAPVSLAANPDPSPSTSTTETD